MTFFLHLQWEWMGLGLSSTERLGMLEIIERSWPDQGQLLSYLMSYQKKKTRSKQISHSAAASPGSSANLLTQPFVPLTLASQNVAVTF